VDHSSELIYELQLLIDPHAPPAVHQIDLTGRPTIDEAQYVLREYFSAVGATSAVTVMVSGTAIGVVTRKRLDEFAGTAADGGAATAYTMGSGERIHLPGEATRYRLLAFACPQCTATAYRIFHDERELPRCPSSHGVMELQR
jgi:hypothetical protein